MLIRSSQDDTRKSLVEGDKKQLSLLWTLKEPTHRVGVGWGKAQRKEVMLQARKACCSETWIGGFQK